MTPCPEYLLRHIRRLVPPPASDSAADAALVESFVRRRDEDSFSALVARHGPMVFRVCRRVLPDWGEAEEAAQATFLVLARRAAAISRPDALAAWLHGTAHRLALMARRDGVRRRERETRRFLATGHVPPPDPLDEISVRERLRIVDEELGRLPEVYRLPLIVCYLEGHTQEEAARRLGWTPGSVRGRLERGRVKLHQRLVRRGVASSGALMVLEASRGIAAATGLPARVVATMVRAALASAAAGTAGGVAPHVAALAEEGVRVMGAFKTKAVLVLLLAASVVAAGAGIVARQAAGPKPGARDQTPQPAAKPKDGPPARADRFGDPLPEGAIQRLGTVRFRSPSGVGCVAFTPDGKGLLSTCWDGNVRLWDSATGKELRRFARHGKGVSKFYVTPDRKTMATHDFDSVVRIWDVASGKMRVVTLGRRGRPLALSPKADLLATAGSNGTFRLWDAATGAEVRRLGPLAPAGVRTSLESVAFSPDGRLVAAGTGFGNELHDRPGVTRVWDVATGKVLLDFGGHRGGVAAVAFGPGGKLFASGSHDATIRLWDTATGKERLVIEVADDPDAPLHASSKAQGFRAGGVRGVTFSADGKVLASAHQDGTVRLWESATGKALRTLRGHGRQATSVAFSPDGKSLASASLDHTIRVWDPATGKLLSPRQGHDGGVTRIAVARDGKRAATAGPDRTVRLWDLASGRELATLRSPAGTDIKALALSPDGKSLATGGGKTICLWDVATGKVVRRLEGHAGGVESLDFSPDGKTLASAAAHEKDGRPVRLWEVATGREVRPIEAVGYFDSVRFSPDGKWLAGGEARQNVHVWDAATGKRRHRFEGQIAFAFLPDGKSLVGWGEADEVSVLSLETGRRVYKFPGPVHIKHLGVSFDLSPDGRLLALFPGAKDLQVWELATGKVRSTFEGASNFRGLAFTPDGRALLSARQDTTVLVWGLAGQTERARPGLSEKEFMALWADLAADDGVRAGRAVRQLAAAGGRSVALLKPLLRPTRAADPARMAALVADLDADRFAVRDKATRMLEVLGELAEPALRKALAASPSLEARRRMEKLLEGATGPITVPEKARGVRAIEVLERVGTPEAAKVLRELAGGAPSARLTREAKAALTRLTPQRDVP
jgi:RNA polymerase sigma factor (sigma-70 family)